jgi:hypothetical protein
LKKKINEDNKYNTKRTEPEEKMALALKEIKKSTINQVKKEQDKILKEVNISYTELNYAFNEAKKLKLEETKKRNLTKTEGKKLLKDVMQKLKIRKGNEKLQEIAQKLKNLEESKEDMVIERLAKIEYMFGAKLIETFANQDKDNLALLNKKIESLSDEDKNKLKGFIEGSNSELSSVFWKFEENQSKFKITEIQISPVNKDTPPSGANFKDQKELAKNILDYQIDKKIEAVVQDVSIANIQAENARVAEEAAKAAEAAAAKTKAEEVAAAAKAKDDAAAKAAAAAAAAPPPPPPPPAGGPPPAGAGGAGVAGGGVWGD